MNYAGFWLRAVAVIIDSVLLGIVQAVVAALALGMGLAEGEEAADGVAGLLGLIIGIAYFCGMESSAKQATLGKMAVGIQVTDLHGQRISFGRALGRYFAKFLSFMILSVGFMMAGWTERKQALHDMVAGTLVVRRSETMEAVQGREDTTLMSGTAPDHSTPR